MQILKDWQKNLFAHTEAVENAVYDVDRYLSAVQLAKLAHRKLKLCASGIFPEVIEREERALRVGKRFVHCCELACVCNDGVVGGGNVAAFKDVFDQRNERFSAVLVFCAQKDWFRSECVGDLFGILLRFFGIKEVAFVADCDYGNTESGASRNVRKDLLVLCVKTA